MIWFILPAHAAIVAIYSVEKNTHDVSSLIAFPKIVAASQDKDGEKIFCEVFDNDSDLKEHELHYAN